MKNNKLRLIVFGLSVITVCFLIAACNDFFQPPGAEKKPPAQTFSTLDRKDELALLHEAKNHETPAAELQAHVQSMLQMNFNAAVQRGETQASAGIITDN